MLLSHNVAIYVPSRDKQGEMQPAPLVSAIVDAVQRHLASRFGGFTTFDAMGGYMMSSGEMHAEPIKVIRSFASGLSDADLSFARDLAAMVAVKLDQECVSLEIDGALTFVEQPKHAVNVA